MLSKTKLEQPFWSLTGEDVLRELKTKEAGLTEAEADKRRTHFGTNEIPDKPRLTRLRIILNQFKSPLIAVLAVAGGVTLLLREWTDAGVILAAVAINTMLGFWQEQKAETVLESLKSYVKTRTRVRRDGTEHERDAENLVPGDVIHLTAGDRIPADVRLLHANDVEVDESVLTGESLPVNKYAEPVAREALLPERSSMAFAGTHVVQGIAEAVVTGTGTATEFGKIALLASRPQEETTPLQRGVARLSRQIGLVLAVVVVLIFFLGIIRGVPLVEMFLVAVAVAVSAIPEGLPVALTVILAAGVERLARQKAVVRRLLAAETLGSTTLIMTDKTGTLTEGRMELVTVVAGDGDEAAMLSDALCNVDTVVENPEEPSAAWVINGRPAEIAIIRAAGERGLATGRCVTKDRLPFDSKVKYSVALLDGGRDRAVYLGAPEILLNGSNANETEKARWLQEIEKRSRAGERLLGLASVAASALDRSGHLPAGLAFKGLFVLRDPLRKSAKGALERIRLAGVRTVIVTGDLPGTALSIAEELGLPAEKHNVITGQELKDMGAAELAARLKNVSVFARVTPEQKLSLAHLYQRRGDVVAMTGDGVNDAPALQAADIGIAVGSGTEVAKSAADLIILDNNYETIVDAIAQGRTITDNIRRVVIYLVSHGLDELILIGGALLIGVPLPINALQILYINFFTDSFPAVAFALEERRKQEKLPTHTKTLLTTKHRLMILAFGLFSSGLLFFFYLVLRHLGLPEAQVSSMVFASLSMYTLLVAFPLRRLDKSLLSFSPFGNRWLCAGVGFGLLLTFAAIYTPILNRLLSTTPLPLSLITVSILISLVIVAGVETAKNLFARASKI